MILFEQTTVPGAALPVADFKDHLRLGTGFADDAVQDAVLENYLRAAIAGVEARTGKVLVTKSYGWSLTSWRDTCGQPLPLAPISAISELRIVDRLGQDTIIDAGAYRLEQDMHRPKVRPVGAALPSIPMGGTVEIDFDAGYGAAWADVPVDLAQATFLLAAHYYEHRGATGDQGDLMPYGVASLIERFRNIRVFGGAGR